MLNISPFGTERCPLPETIVLCCLNLFWTAFLFDNPKGTTDAQKNQQWLVSVHDVLVETKAGYKGLR